VAESAPMSSGGEQLPDWERLLAAERHLQKLVPGSVLVGGTAAAIHARHRVSLEGNHALEDLRFRFDEVLTALEAAVGWRTEPRPMLILGELDGVLTGIRQLRRTRPLDTEEVAGLRVPTLAEMARIKAWLLATRDTVRDYLDTVVLFERLGDAGVADALRPFDEIYRQPTGVSPLAEVVERLAAAAPEDKADVDLTQYRSITPPWNDWRHLAASGRYWARCIAPIVLEGAVTDDALQRSRALWNRTRCDLENDETLAQILDRGEIEVWRDVYRRAKSDARLRQRIARIVLTVPTPLPRFWLAALASLGESVDLGAPVPDYTTQSV